MIAKTPLWHQSLPLGGRQVLVRLLRVLSLFGAPHTGLLAANAAKSWNTLPADCTGTVGPTPVDPVVSWSLIPACHQGLLLWCFDAEML